MSLSNTGGHGRGDQTGSIIGDVINHRKKQYWGVPRMHYHQVRRRLVPSAPELAHGHPVTWSDQRAPCGL